MKALLNLFVESAANDQAAYIEWNNMSVVNRTATSEQSWRRKNQRHVANNQRKPNN